MRAERFATSSATCVSPSFTGRRNRSRPSSRSTRAPSPTLIAISTVVTPPLPLLRALAAGARSHCRTGDAPRLWLVSNKGRRSHVLETGLPVPQLRLEWPILPFDGLRRLGYHASA